MLGRKLFHFLVILLVCAALKKGNHKRLKHSHRHRNDDRGSRQVQQNFHEVDAFGDDFVDFGAMSGPHGQFSWHADFPLEWWCWQPSRVDQFRLIANIYLALKMNTNVYFISDCLPKKRKRKDFNIIFIAQRRKQKTKAEIRGNIVMCVFKHKKYWVSENGMNKIEISKQRSVNEKTERKNLSSS